MRRRKTKKSKARRRSRTRIIVGKEEWGRVWKRRGRSRRKVTGGKRSNIQPL